MNFSKKELETIVNLLADNNVDVELQNRINECLKVLENYDLCLWRFYWDCGRGGEVEGVFKATKKQVENIIGATVNFGEILGKHSEVYGTIEEDEITLVSSEPSFVLSSNTHGYNPFYYWTCNDCGYELNPDTGTCDNCSKEV